MRYIVQAVGVAEFQARRLASMAILIVATIAMTPVQSSGQLQDGTGKARSSATLKSGQVGAGTFAKKARAAGAFFVCPA